MKRLLLIVFVFQLGQAHAQDDFKIQCEYSLESGQQISVLLSPFKNTPSGSHVKEFEIIIQDESFLFSGKDFRLATMKWDDLTKLHLGVLIENSNHKLNFIHVGPANVHDSFSFFDIYRDLGPLKPGRYEPYGVCEFVRS